MIQGDEEWLAIRCGRVTASRVHDIVATTKSGGYGAGRKNYMAELVGERLTGVPAEQYVNRRHGGRQSDASRAPASPMRSPPASKSRRSASSITPPSPWPAARPMGLVGNDGLVEIKCPNRSHPSSTRC